MTEPVRKLLGGYATGTLTPEEQNALFAAAVQDQELFNLLADEQVLRDYLMDPVFRSELLQDLEQVPEQSRPLPQREPRQWIGWLFGGSIAAATVAIFLITLIPPREKPRVAQVSLPELVARQYPVTSTPKAKVAVPVPSIAPPPVLAPPTAAPPHSNILSRIQPAPASVAAPSAFSPLKVAVLDFDSGRADPQVGQSLSKYLSDQLATDRSYSVVNREKVASAMAEHGKDTLITQETAAKIGRAVGADAVLMGRVSNSPVALRASPSNAFRAEIAPAQPAVYASLIDSATGKTLRVAQASAHPGNLEAAAAVLGKALELRATVTDVNGGIVTLDIGTKAGVKPGDRFRILHGDEVLGEATITAVKEGFAVGTFEGAKKPQPGDQAVFIRGR